MNLEDIWAQYQTSVRALLQTKVSDSADVDDILQDVFIKVHNNLTSLKSQGSIKPWLFRIANNAIADFYRAKNKSTTPDADQLWYNDSEPELQQLMAQCIEPFIKALPAETAAVLTAIDLKGQSQKDYARKRGISYSALKSRVQRGRAQLRKLFEECCVFTFDKHGSVVDCENKPSHVNSC